MIKKKCIVYGAGTYGQVYASYLNEHYDVIGFIDDNPIVVDTVIDGKPVIGDRSYFDHENDRNIDVFVPIGNNKTRVELLSLARIKGFSTPAFVHPDTQIHESVKIGSAVYILPSTSIMPFTSIGDNTMISMGVNIAHHVMIEPGCFFSQGTNIGASIQIRSKAYCGIASTIMTGVKTIGENSVIGAGAVVINDIPDNCTAVGVPARPIKFH